MRELFRGKTQKRMCEIEKIKSPSIDELNSDDFYRWMRDSLNENPFFPTMVFHTDLYVNYLESPIANIVSQLHVVKKPILKR